MAKGAIVLFFVLSSAFIQCLATSDANAPAQSPSAAKAPPKPPKTPKTPPPHPPPPPHHLPWYVEILLRNKKCFEDLGKAKRTCTPELVRSWYAKEFLVGKDCCKAINSAEEDCVYTLFSRIGNPFFLHCLMEQCAIKFPPSAPAAPPPEKL